MNLKQALAGIRFIDDAGPSGEVFGAALRATPLPIRCHALEASVDAADVYLDLIGRSRESVVVHRDRVDLASVEAASDFDGIDIAIYPATMPSLHEEFFCNPRVHFFADHVYLPTRGYESPMLFTVATTATSVDRLAGILKDRERHDGCVGQRAQRLARLFGSAFITDKAVIEILQSPAVRRIRLHGLGPEGTNIAQCCRRFIDTHLLGGKSEIVIHGVKVEPLEYSAIAAEEVANGIVPLHMECAVFYGLQELFVSRPGELVFAAHHYMALDAMQLAARKNWHREEVSGLKIASHPSPRPLANALFEMGATYIRASSNSDAAEMLARGEVDLAITTGEAKAANSLATVHDFGSPTMLFTIGTSVNAATLLRYQVEAALLAERLLSSARQHTKINEETSI